MVEIKWLDSKGVTSDWEFKDDVKPMTPCNVTSVGFLYDDNDECVTLLQSEAEKQILGRLTIPKVCIVSIRTLKFEKKTII